MKLRISFNGSSIFVIFIVIIQLLNSVSSLHCIQCHRQEKWFSPEKNEEHIQKCDKGAIEPTKCKNATHTHCIYSYYRRGGSADATITERRCGIEQDITGCTLYKSSKRRLRHLLGGSQTSDLHQKSSIHRRRETTLFVEVCEGGCLGDGCINSSISQKTFTTLSLFFLFSCISYICFFV